MVTRLDHSNSSALFEKYDFLQAFFLFLFFFFQFLDYTNNWKKSKETMIWIFLYPPALCALRPELFLSIHHNTIIIIIIIC